MLVEEILRLTANLAILYVTIVLGVFIGVYGTRRWRKYPGGRAVMQFVVSLEVLLLLAVAGNWLPGWQGVGKELVRDVVYLYIAYASTQMVWTLLFRWQEVVEAVTGGSALQEAAAGAQEQEQP